MRFKLMEHINGEWVCVGLFDQYSLAAWFVDLAKLADPKRLFHITFNR